ncbi:hypothetical protein [Glutamicibacter sp. PS]|uniref:hypothetical protein n=1 Tax=Glutamicibacter sp. PS TaxID=3075634 RepID=UPI00284E3998|nr:hypothetical protein [Glutamicibacter sp. PS]MDR4533244.1 hypothetical protein [Glutamicibacter sp. PS]
MAIPIELEPAGREIQDAYGQVITAIESTASEFSQWVELGQSPRVMNVQKAILSYFRRHTELFEDLARDFLGQLNPQNLIGLRKLLTGAKGRIKLAQNPTFEGCQKAISWLNNEFSMDFNLRAWFPNLPEGDSRRGRINELALDIRDLSRILESEQHLSALDAAVASSQSLKKQVAELEALGQNLKGLPDRFNAYESNAQETLAHFEKSASNRLIEINDQLYQAQDMASQAQAALEKAQREAEASASENLSTTFSDLAKQSKRSFVTFTWLAGLLFGAAIILAFFTSPLAHPERTMELTETIYRLALTGGAFGLATYLSRQAAHYRTLSTWSKVTEVQITEFRAYTDLIANTAQRDEIRRAFAARIFGPDPTLPSKLGRAREGAETQAEPSVTDPESDKAVSTITPAEVIDLLRRLPMTTGKSD